jgi:hypothetical protein
MSSWTNAGANFYYVDTETSGNDFGYYYDDESDTLAYNTIKQIGWDTSLRLI